MAACEFVVYRGETFRVQTSGRYYYSDRKAPGERLLHRRVWSDHHGSIPEDHVVHHIDGDWRNNDIANLTLMLRVDHAAKHMRERLAQDGGMERNAEHLERARLAAAEWHRSEEGLAWHSENGKRTWVEREPHKVVCSVCGAEHSSYYPNRSRFCSKPCQQKWFYEKAKDVERACSWCGKAFMASRYRKTACCSRACSNRKRAADDRLQSDPG